MDFPSIHVGTDMCVHRSTSLKKRTDSATIDRKQTMSGEEPQSVIAQVVPKASFVEDVETFVQGTYVTLRL